MNNLGRPTPLRFKDLAIGDIFNIPAESDNRTQLKYCDCIKINDTQHKDNNGIIRTVEDLNVYVYEVNTEYEYNRFLPDRIVTPLRTIEEESKIIKDLLAKHTTAELIVRHKNMQEFMEGPRFAALLHTTQENLRTTEFLLFTAKSAAISNNTACIDEYGQPTATALTNALNTVINSKNYPSANKEALAELKRLRELKTTWVREEENKLRYVVDNYIKANETNSSEKTQPNLEEALKKAIKAYGRTWRKDISMAWSTGNYGPLKDDWNTVAVLQNARNTLGPEWLNKVKDPRGMER